MAWKPVIAGGVNVPSGTGVSVPGLPVWTFTAGAVSSGLFSTNSVSPVGTTTITFSEDTKYGPTSFTGFFGHFTTGTLVYLTDSSGVSSVFHLIANSSGGTLLVEGLALDASAVWSGDYQVIFIPPTNVAEAANASALSTFTGNIGTPNTLDINTGIITNAT